MTTSERAVYSSLRSERLCYWIARAVLAATRVILGRCPSLHHPWYERCGCRIPSAAEWTERLKQQQRG